MTDCLVAWPAVLGRIEVVEIVLAGEVVQRGAPAVVEPTELALHGQHPAHGPVEEVLRHAAIVDPARQRRSVTADRGQFHVDSRGQRDGRRMCR
jgi:hypothetical protein